MTFIPAPLLFGLILLVASISLFVSGKFKPELYRDSDNIYSVIGVICAVLLMATPELGIPMLLQQMLLIGVVSTLMWQNLQNREQETKRRSNKGRNANNPERSGNKYRAQLDDYEQPPVRSRVNRERSLRSEEMDYRDDPYQEDYNPRYKRSLPEDDRPRTSRRRNSRSESAIVPQSNDDWSNEHNDWDESPKTERRSRKMHAETENPAPMEEEYSTRRRRSSGTKSANNSDYVDYEPLEQNRRKPKPEDDGEPIVFPDQY